MISIRNNEIHYMADHAGVPWLTRALSCGARPSKWLSFSARGAVLAPVFVFIKPTKNKLISMKPNSNLNHFQKHLLHIIPLPFDQYNLFWSYKKRAPKPLLGRQNWVTSTGGCHNLVPGLTTERRPPAWSAISAKVKKKKFYLNIRCTLRLTLVLRA